MPHDIDDCPHNPTFEHITSSLSRLDRHTERTAIAMEKMAATTGAVSNLQDRVGKLETDLGIAFSQIRTIDGYAASDMDVQGLISRVTKIELRHARESGIEVVTGRRAKFWDGVKQQLTPYAVIGLFFIFWLCDRYDVFQHLAKWRKEMWG